MIRAYKSYWKNFWNFRDRTSIDGYWWVILINAIIAIALLVFMYRSVAGLGSGFTNTSALLGPVAPIAILISWPALNVIPGLAMTVRRLHDTGRSGAYYLFAFIPVAGLYIMIWFLTSRTKDPRENRFGYRPQI